MKTLPWLLTSINFPFLCTASNTNLDHDFPDLNPNPSSYPASGWHIVPESQLWFYNITFWNFHQVGANTLKSNVSLWHWSNIVLLYVFIYPLEDLLEMSDIQPIIKTLIQRCSLTVALVFADIVLMNKPLTLSDLLRNLFILFCFIFKSFLISSVKLCALCLRREGDGGDDHLIWDKHMFTDGAKT